jgi:hypothetical protein
MRPSAHHALLLSLSLLGALTGCQQVDYIELSPGQVVLKQTGQEAWVQAKAMARTGVRQANAPITFTVANPEIASVDKKGLVKPIKSGETEVVVRSGSVEARVPVSVIFAEKVVAEPAQVVITEGTPASNLTIKVYGKDDKLLGDRKASLSSRNKTVVQIVGDGQLLPLDPGETIVDVQVDAAKTSVQVKVEAEVKGKKK